VTEYRERTPPTRRCPLARVACVLGPLMVLACGSDRATPDAALTVVDAISPQADEALYPPPNLDARVGVPGGSPCDASEQCLSGACTMGVCSDWTHALKIAVDTTVTGAAVSQAVMSFPLLIRLSAMNFEFEEARGYGSSIRFLDSSGHTLAYQIERWDSERAVAEIWVLIPRILGNSRDNVVYMYWGNQLAAQSSSGPSVFGDFSSVFHMGKDPNTGATLIDDDSGHGNFGTVRGQTSVDPRGEGIAGVGLALNGSSMMSTTIELPPPQPVTVSLWLKTTSESSGGGIAGFASKQVGDKVTYDRFVTMNGAGQLSFAVLHRGAMATLTSLTSYKDGKWHFIAARFSSAGQYLFVDGESVADDPTMTSADTYSGYWRFGEEPTPASTSNYLSGSVDEARISTHELSDAWIKLSYATQRPDATAVVYSARP
jgi:hypothetical protein